MVITGDILHSRVARSNAMLLPRLGAKVVLCGPEELLPEEALGLDMGEGRRLRLSATSMRRCSGADVVMMLRIQKERLADVAIDLGEYIARYQLSAERLAAPALRMRW